MILLTMLTATATVAIGPAFKLGPPNPDRTPVILALDKQGRVATRITCLRNEWVNPDDSAAKLLMSTKVMATVIKKDGKLTDIEDLGPSRFDCVIMPDRERADAR